MIPVPENVCTSIDFTKMISSNDPNEKKYGFLLWSQWEWINKNKEWIVSKAEALYTKYSQNKLQSHIKNRCVNFPLLEKRLEQFNNKEITPKEVIPPQKPKIKISFLERTNTSKDNGKGR